MTYDTAEIILNRVRRDLDLVDEPSVTDQMLVDWLNDGIGIAEGIIHTLYEDYFLTKSALTLVVAQADYDLATLIPNMYAGKIRAITYRNGSTIYPIKRVRGANILEVIALTNEFGTSDWYQYILRNDADSAGFTLQLVPTSREAGAVVDVWYLRQATRIVLATISTQKVDIPQWSSYIVSYVKKMAAKHEGHPMMDALDADCERLKTEMIDALSAITPDEDTVIQPNSDLWEEHA